MWSPEIKNDNYNVLILLAGIVVYAIVSAWMIGADNPIFSFLPFFLPLIIMGWYSIGLMPPLLILLFFSELKLPGVSDRLNLFYALALVALPLLMLRKYPMLRRLQWHAMHRWLILFLVAVLFVIAMRGAGIQALGGETMGGFAYVQIVLRLIFMVFLSGTLRLSPRKVENSSGGDVPDHGAFRSWWNGEFITGSSRPGNPLLEDLHLPYKG
ncbi:MAG: hypothetical protein KatS3mg044_0929 [Rhodothermaceae bacterium]|nr:MAG: hypothetical protein KatS3mg044_0929 [Rhodothermaceae bacterium]